MIQCIDCQQPYPDDSIPYLCTACGGIYDFVEYPKYNPNEVDDSLGIWRYRHTFGLPEDAPIVTLGEGDTPLVSTSFQDRDVYLKLEYLNPTHSFKDRGTAVMVSFLRSRRVGEAVDDSSGNAGSSFAAYAIRAGVKARVFLPAYASGPKRDQISAYGAEVIAIDGPRSKASDAVREAARRGSVYASHALLPHGLPGYTTTAFELINQLGTVPGTVILPVGQGNLLLAMGRGFQTLFASGLIQQVPRLFGVQAQACAPLWTAFHYGKKGLDEIHEGETIAEGIRIRHPYRIDALLDVVKDSNGGFTSVREEDILPGQRELAHRGFFVEPTSAIVWPALTQVVDQVPGPIVLVLTGSGLKAIQPH
jgi:threonine synthase